VEKEWRLRLPKRPVAVLQVSGLMDLLPVYTSVNLAIHESEGANDDLVCRDRPISNRTTESLFALSTRLAQPKKSTEEERWVC
jgi:hypothetical protein